MGDSKQNTKFNYSPLKRENNNKYFCSQFVWFAFKSVGINLDSGKFLKFTITPQKIYNSKLIIHLGTLKGN